MSDRFEKGLTVIFVTLTLAAAPGFADAVGDPTRPPVVQVGPSPEAKTEGKAPLELQAVFFAEGRRIAIINDQRVAVNDTVLSARILAIERDRVAVQRDGETIELELVRSDVKRPSPAPAPTTEWADAETTSPPRDPADAPMVSPPDWGDSEATTDLPAAPAPVGEGIEP